jgi:hypothetical protein
MENTSFLLSLKREIVNDLCNLNKNYIMYPPRDENMMRFHNIYKQDINNFDNIRINLNNLLNEINIYLDTHCNHEWEEDLIELLGGTLEPIKYCVHCELNYGEKFNLF